MQQSCCQQRRSAGPDDALPVAAALQREPQSLTEALERLVAPEEVHAACPLCQRSGAVKQASFRQLPPTVMIQVKRFRCGCKLNEPLQFPVDDLDLRPFLTPTGKSRSRKRKHTETWEGNALGVYQLAALIEHKGESATSGHYVAYVRQHKADGQTVWHACNDSHVTEVRPADCTGSDDNGCWLLILLLHAPALHHCWLMICCRRHTSWAVHQLLCTGGSPCRLSRTHWNAHNLTSCFTSRRAFEAFIFPAAFVQQSINHVRGQVAYELRV
jgi:Ubiquitin carboxyl-terminal hydrolase